MINEDIYEKILRQRGIQAGFAPKEADKQEEAQQPAEFGLSAGQMGMWFLQQMKPDSPVYNNPSAMKIEGKLDLNALTLAVRMLTKEYETLRTGFRVNEGKMVQYIKEQIDCSIHQIDCEGQDYETIKRKMNELAREPFDLEADDLFRVYLLRVSEEENYLLINIHHIISDGWSKGILLEKLSAIYKTYAEKKEWTPCKTRVHYSSYVKWQSEWLAGKAGQEALQFWEEELKDRPPVLNLVPDKVRGQIQSGKGGITEFSVLEETYQKVKVLCQQNSLSPFIFLLGVMNVYLYKYTAQKDILIGTPIAGRNKKEFEDVSGYFVNSIVMRNKLNEKESFLSFAKKVKKSSIRAYQNQDIPFNLLVEKLNPVRELSYSPIFQVMMQFDNAPVPELNLGDLKLIPESLDTGSSQVDLSVTFWEEGKILKGTFEWDSALFDEERIQNMIVNWKTLLDGILAHPEKPVSSFGLLSEDQYQKMIYDWNATEYQLPKTDVLEYLRLNAELIGEETAVLHGEEKITYQELEQRSGKLAAVLREKGVRKGRMVALCMESSIQYIVALYGILKAGGIVVPIDSTYPEKRIQAMMEELEDPVLLTSSKHTLKLILYKKELLTIESLLEVCRQSESLHVRTEETDVLCVIFTSGSTGNPKGVMLSYESMKNLVQSFIHSYDVTKNDHIMSISGIASASFIGEILPAVSAGAMLVLPKMETVLDVESLETYMEQQKITILSTVPSMIGRLNQYGKLPECTRVLLSGGESIQPSHVVQLKKVKIANGYGLTESGICNTYKLTEVEQLNESNLSNVGKPVINNAIYVLDKDKKPVPPYVCGEIYVGGISLSLGYLNQNELTKEHFIDNPFAKGKLLKTGDMGYFLTDGDLMFIGREDRQVQLRGFRIELSEIERALEKHAGVKETAAVFEEKEQFLAVYYTTDFGIAVSPEQVIHWLQEQLPAYMIPKYGICIEKMPYNKNGKIAYNELLLLGAQNKKHDILKEKPQTDTEKMLAELWKKYLKEEDIGIKDNFFDIGGHSLMLSQIYNELKQVSKAELKIVNLFQYPTICQLAAFLDQQDEGKEEKAKERGKKQRNAYAKPLFNRNRKN